MASARGDSEPTRAVRLRTLSRVRADYPLLVIDNETSSCFARIADEELRDGRKLRRHDAWIAATALQHHAAVVTQDADFSAFVSVPVIRVGRIPHSRDHNGVLDSGERRSWGPALARSPCGVGRRRAPGRSRASRTSGLASRRSTELQLAVGSPGAFDGDGAVVDLGFVERLHELVVRAVAERLVFVANGGGVLGRVGGALFGEPAGEDLVRGPGVDGVRGRLNLEHPVRHVLRDPLLGVPAAAGSALELPKLLAALIDGDDPGLGIELGLDQLVLILAGDLPHHPDARWRTMITSN